MTRKEDNKGDNIYKHTFPYAYVYMEGWTNLFLSLSPSPLREEKKGAAF